MHSLLTTEKININASTIPAHKVPGLFYDNDLDVNVTFRTTDSTTWRDNLVA